MKLRDVLKQVKLPGWRAVVAGLIDFHVSNAVLLAAVSLTLIWQKSAPAVSILPATVASVYTVAERVGMLWLTGWMLYKGVLFFVGGSGVAGFLRGIIGRYIMLSLALVSIRQGSPFVADAVHAIETNPHASITAALGVVAVYAAFSIFDRLVDIPRQQYAAARSAASGVAVAVSSNIRRPRQAKGVRRTAVHEVGHVLLYAALPSMPDKLTVKVLHEISMTDRYRGYVRNDQKWTAAETELLTQWNMLLYLGGTVAEQLVYGSRADGAEEDNARWTHTAQQYLARGYGEVYFPEPSNAGQIEHNRLVINSLKAQHHASLMEFLTVNRALLDELTERLITEREIGAEALAPFFKRVVFTEAVRPVQLHEA